MNDARRAVIKKAIEVLESITNDLTILSEEERDAFENLPENFQATDQGEKMDDDATEIDDVAQEVEALAGRLSEVI